MACLVSIQLDNFTDPMQVSQAIELINQALDQVFPYILIEGEVASFKVNQNKYIFFDVKDESASLGCFMMAFALKFPIEDGMKVKVLAQPKLTQWGKFSLTVREVVPVGEGSIKKSFEILKQKLQKEGLFDVARKKTLPKIPHRIGVVSSSGAAGYADFIKILGNRWGGLNITLVDVTVQGIDSPGQIVGALDYLNTQAEPYDVIALVRGGGSADDLSAFNHEDVVRAVAASRTPTIVGVGHEVDVSLCDLAADVRAATPSNAAELLVPDKKDVIRTAQQVVTTAKNAVDACLSVFEQDHIVALERLETRLQQFFVQKGDTLRYLQKTLYQLSPQKVLSRGYAIIKSGEQVIYKTSDVIIGTKVNIQVSDGIIKAEVTDVSN